MIIGDICNYLVQNIDQLVSIKARIQLLVGNNGRMNIYTQIIYVKVQICRAILYI